MRAGIQQRNYYGSRRVTVTSGTRLPPVRYSTPAHPSTNGYLTPSSTRSAASTNSLSSASMSSTSTLSQTAAQGLYRPVFTQQSVARLSGGSTTTLPSTSGLSHTSLMPGMSNISGSVGVPVPSSASAPLQLQLSNRMTPRRSIYQPRTSLSSASTNSLPSASTTLAPSTSNNSHASVTNDVFTTQQPTYSIPHPPSSASAASSTSTSSSLPSSSSQAQDMATRYALADNIIQFKKRSRPVDALAQEAQPRRNPQPTSQLTSQLTSQTGAQPVSQTTTTTATTTAIATSALYSSSPLNTVSVQHSDVVVQLHAEEGGAVMAFDAPDASTVHQSPPSIDHINSDHTRHIHIPPQTVESVLEPHLSIVQDPISEQPEQQQHQQLEKGVVSQPTLDYQHHHQHPPDNNGITSVAQPHSDIALAVAQEETVHDKTAQSDIVHISSTLSQPILSSSTTLPELVTLATQLLKHVDQEYRSLYEHLQQFYIYNPSSNDAAVQSAPYITHAKRYLQLLCNSSFLIGQFIILANSAADVDQQQTPMVKSSVQEEDPQRAMLHMFGQDTIQITLDLLTTAQEC